MRSTTNITQGIIGQTVALRFMEGRPTSATFSVFRDWADDTGTAEFSGTATLLSPSTTLTSASGAGQVDPQKLNLTSTSIVTGQRYLLSEGSMREWVDPIEVESGYIRVRHPLKNAYTTAAAFASTTLTATIDSTWIALTTSIGNVADPNPDYRVKWTVVYGGVTYVQYSYFDVVREQVAHHVDLADLNDRAPGLVDSLPQEYDAEQGRPLIDAAWKMLRAKLSSLSIDIDAIRDDEFLDELMILSALKVLATGGWRPLSFPTITEYITATSDAFDRFVEQHVQVTLKHRLAQGQSSAAEPVRAQSYWSK